MLIALDIRPLTTHPFFDGAPFLLLLKTPPTFNRSLRFFHTIRYGLLLIFYPSCLAVCARHLSLILTSVLNFSMSHSSVFPSTSSNTSNSSSCTVHVLPLRGFYSLLHCHKGTSVQLLSPPPDHRYKYLFFMTGPDPLPDKSRINGAEGREPE